MLNEFESHLALNGLEYGVVNPILDIINYNSNLVNQFTDPEIDELAQVFPFVLTRDGRLDYKSCRLQLRQFLQCYPTFRGTSKQKVGTKIYYCFANNAHAREGPRSAFH